MTMHWVDDRWIVEGVNLYVQHLTMPLMPIMTTKQIYHSFLTAKICTCNIRSFKCSISPDLGLSIICAKNFSDIGATYNMPSSKIPYSVNYWRWKILTNCLL